MSVHKGHFSSFDRDKIQETKRRWWHKVAIVRRVDSCDFTDKGNYIHLAPVVQTMDSAIHRINHYSLDNSIGFACVFSVDSDLSGG